MSSTSTFQITICHKSHFHLVFVSWSVLHELRYHVWYGLWEAGLGLNGGSFLSCAIPASWHIRLIKVLFSRCTERSRASGGRERGAAVPAEVHHSGGTDCVRFRPADVMNRGYCLDVWEHMEEFVDMSSDRLWILLTCKYVTCCWCQQKSAACACLSCNEVFGSRALYISLYIHMLEKRIYMCWYVCAWYAPSVLLFTRRSKRWCSE